MHWSWRRAQLLKKTDALLTLARGWHDTYRVADGQAEGLLLGKTEAMWLRACWLATAR